MGNSDSQFKRSRSQYGSTRSVAFSLPSKWDRRSYVHGEPINRTPSVASSTIRSPPKPILRNPSSASSSNSLSSYKTEVQSRHMSRSLHSLHEPTLYEQQAARLRRPSSASSVTLSHQLSHQLTQGQYSDIYLKNDLKRHFRAQDRTNSVAQLDHGQRFDVGDSTTSLDRRLFALKSQRNQGAGNPHPPEHDENKREGATEKRIRSKKRKAPLPNPSSIAHVGLFRKKAPAPQPPIRGKSRSLSSLTNVGSRSMRSDDGGSAVSLFDEIETELMTRHNIPISPTRESQIEIPTPDYNSNQQITPRQGVKVLPIKMPKPKAPTKPTKEANIEAQSEQHSPSVKYMKDASSGSRDKNMVVADIEIHKVPDIDSAQEPRVIPIKQQPVKQKEVREIAIQCNAPVEIAIQCSGNTLKQRNTDTIRSNASSLTELVHLLNTAVQAAGEAKATSTHNAANVSTECIGNVSADISNDSQSTCSDASSGRFRNSASQKVIPMHEVLAGVPEPPPLPSLLNVKLLQRKTIRDNAPVSMAPHTPDREIIEDNESFDVSPPRDFSNFQKELMAAYEKIDDKRKTNPTPTKTGQTVKRQDSNSSEVSALKIFRHARTIMGINTPPTQEAESDSGHDEPSDYNNPLTAADRTPSVPNFVLDDIAKSLSTTESEWSFEDSASRSSLKNDKSKFNSIRRLKKSVNKFVSSISRNSGRKDITLPPREDVFEDPAISYSDENWTMSGRSKSPRPSITQPDTFSPERQKTTSDTLSSPTHSIGSPDRIKSSPQFKQTNMKSFELLTPMGYPGPSPRQNGKDRPNLGVFRDETLADIPL